MSRAKREENKSVKRAIDLADSILENYDVVPALDEDAYEYSASYPWTKTVGLVILAAIALGSVVFTVAWIGFQI